MYLQLLNTNDSIHSLKWQEASSNCFIMHKKIFLKIKGFNERYKGWGYEDTDLFLQAHKYGCSLILHSGIEVWHISHEEFFYKRFIDSFKNLIRFTIFNFIDVFNIDFILRAYNLQIYMLEMGIRQLLLKREATK
jgi:GT2 family glycosyltransferase